MPCWIVNEELYRLTQDAIESIGDADFIIIDNASPMGGGYLREKAKIYIRNQENLGYAKAVNQGLVLSHIGSYKAIANNDIRISSNWMKVAKQVFEGDEDVYSCHFRMTPYNEIFTFGDKTWYSGKERWCSSSFFVLNKDQQLFLYDENYGLGGYEDWDINKRIHDAGLKQAYTTKAAYQHKDSSTQNLLDQTKRSKEDQRRREYFKSKFGEYPDVLFAKEFPEQMKIGWREGFSL